MSVTTDRINTFFRYKDLLRELVVRDVKLKYRRSFLGYVWSILNPLLIMLVMTLVFSQMFQRGIENFPVYLLTGQALFDFMNNATHMSMYSVLDNGALIKKNDGLSALYDIAGALRPLLCIICALNEKLEA